MSRFATSWRVAWQGAVDPDGASGFAHHGVAVLADGRVVAFEAAGDAVLVLAPDGTALERWPSGLVTGHGITVDGSADAPVLWVADPGRRKVPDGSGGLRLCQLGPGQVVALTTSGRWIDGLPAPGPPHDRHGPYAPTSIAIDTTGHRWVADGYGQSLVHRFAPDGTHLGGLTGTEGAGRFACPHALAIDDRGPEPLLVVADRGNGRLQWFGLDGTFRRAVTVGLSAPSDVAVVGDLLVVADLHARLVVLDGADRVVGELGADPSAPADAGWPNALDAAGGVIAPSPPSARFRSPHALAVNAEGALYVAEWLIGGRMTRLDPMDHPPTPATPATPSTILTLTPTTPEVLR